MPVKFAAAVAKALKRHETSIFANQVVVHGLNSMTFPRVLEEARDAMNATGKKRDVTKIGYLAEKVELAHPTQTGMLALRLSFYKRVKR